MNAMKDIKFVTKKILQVKRMLAMYESGTGQSSINVYTLGQGL